MHFLQKCFLIEYFKCDHVLFALFGLKFVGYVSDVPTLMYVKEVLIGLI